MIARRITEAALGGALLVFGCTVLAYAAWDAQAGAVALGAARSMSLGGALVFAWCGAVLLLPSRQGWVRHIQFAVGAVIVAGSLAALVGCCDGDPWRTLLSGLLRSEELLKWPGRLSSPMAVGLLCAGAAFMLASAVRGERGCLLVQVLTAIVAYIGIFGVTTHATALSLLYQTTSPIGVFGWPAAMATLGLGVAIGLRLAGEPRFVSFYQDRPQRRAFSSTLALMLVLLTISWSVGMGMFVEDAVKSIEHAQEDSLRANAAVLEDVIREARMEAAELLALSRVGQLMAASPTAGAAAVEAEVQRIMRVSRHNGVAHMSVVRPDATLAVHVGPRARFASLSMGLREPEGSALVWAADHLILIAREPIEYDGRRVGYAEMELPLPRLDARISAWQKGGDTRRTVLCGSGAGGPVCIQLGGGRAAEHESGWAGIALDGMRGVEQVSGNRSRARIVAYGPVGDTGLAIIDEVRTTEVFAPLHDRLRRALAVLLALAAVGTLVIYWRTGPALRRLVSLQSELRAVLNNVPAGIVTVDANGRIASANPRAEAMFGQQGLTGLALKAFLIDTPGHRAYGLQAHAQKNQGSAPPGFREVTARRTDQSIFPVDAAISECTVEGETGCVAVLLDATERKVAEEKLAAWARVFEHGGWGVVVVGADGRTERLNSAFAWMHGYTVEEAMQLPAEHFFAEEVRQELPKLVKEAHTHGRVRRESLHRRADGSVFPVLIDATVVRDEKGEVRYEIVNVQDISQIRQASEALRRNEALLRKVLETLPVGVWVADASGRIVLGNAADQRIWGGARYEDIAEYKGWCTGDEKNLQPDEWGLMRALTRGESALNEVINIQAFDGSLKCILHSSVPLLDESGCVQGAIAVNEDITERQRAAEALRQSHEFFRSIFQDTSVGVALVAPDGRWLAANRALTRIIGYSEEELLSLAFQDVTHPEDLEKDLRMVEGMLSGRLDHHQKMEKRYLRKDGGMVWVLLSASLVRNEQSEPEYFIAQIQDISERKAVEEELLRSREQLRELAAHHEAVREEERKRIAMEVHDELGQLLTALKIEISLLRMRFAGQPELGDRVAQMRKLVEETINMVRNVANHLRPTALNLGLVAALEWLTQDFSQRTQVPCALEIRGDDVGLSDRHITALFRIVQESLTNVARHARAQAVSVRLARDDEALSLEVRDDGRGFDTRLIGKRESFGLLGIRERVVMLGGTVDFISEPGKGTMISIVIPLDRPAR